MSICFCSLAGTAACKHCSNNENAIDPNRQYSITVSTNYLTETEKMLLEKYTQAHNRLLMERDRVRCEICKYYIKHNKRCKVWNHGVHVNDYCSRFERKLSDKDRCGFCGGKLSEIREHEGKQYRHCYGCHFDWEADDDCK